MTPPPVPGGFPSWDAYFQDFKASSPTAQANLLDWYTKKGMTDVVAYINQETSGQLQKQQVAQQVAQQLQAESKSDLLRRTLNGLSPAAKDHVERALANSINWDNPNVSEIQMLMEKAWLLNARAQTRTAAELYQALRNEAGYSDGFKARRISPPPTQNWFEIINRAIYPDWPRTGRTRTKEGIIDYLGKQMDLRLHALTGQTIAANIARDPTKPRYRVVIHGDMQECHSKNDWFWQCENVKDRIEALQPGDRLNGWFHPNCHCEVIPAFKAPVVKKPRAPRIRKPAAKKFNPRKLTDAELASLRKMNSKELLAIQEYTDEGDPNDYNYQNGVLRDLPWILNQLDDKRLAEVKGKIAATRSGIRKNPIPADTVLYRAQRNLNAFRLADGSVANLADLKTGSTFTWKGFQSTTPRPEWLDHATFGPIRLEVEAPAGTPGVFLDPIDGKSAISRLAGEHELLLDDGLEVRIKSVEKKKDEHGVMRQTIRVEIVPKS